MLNREQAEDCANEIAWMESRATADIIRVLQKHGAFADRKPVGYAMISYQDNVLTGTICDDGTELSGAWYYSDIHEGWKCSVPPIPGTAAALAREVTEMVSNG